MKRLVAKVKNDSVIYHSIADVVTEQMQQVIYDSSFYDLIDLASIHTSGGYVG